MRTKYTWHLRYLQLASVQRNKCYNSIFKHPANMYRYIWLYISGKYHIFDNSQQFWLNLKANNLTKLTKLEPHNRYRVITTTQQQLNNNKFHHVLTDSTTNIPPPELATVACWERKSRACRESSNRPSASSSSPLSLLPLSGESCCVSISCHSPCLVFTW